MRHLNFIITVTILLTCYIRLTGQISINTVPNAPDNSAALDIQFTDKGLLIPRVSLSSTTDVSTIPNPANSLVVYNTNAGMINGNGTGFYYWDATAGMWMFMATASNGPGSAGQVLTSSGSGNKPQWSTLSLNGGGLTGCANCISMISPASSTLMTWVQCADYCRSGNWGGYTDWRMPTLDEAITYRTNRTINTSLSSGWTTNVWTVNPWDARINSTASPGIWVVFNESAGDWDDYSYSGTVRCRCVR